MELVGDSSGFYRFSGSWVNYNTMGISVHFDPGPGYAIFDPSISLAQIPSEPSVGGSVYTISGNQVTYSGTSTSWAIGAPINQLGVGALTLTIPCSSTCIGLCDPATVATVNCTDTCPCLGFIQIGNDCYSYGC